MPNSTVPADAIGLPLSHLFTDPLVRRAFERIERDDGQAAVLAYRPRPRLSGGSAAGLLRWSRTAQDIIEIGRDLIAVKAKLGHGNFLPWIEAEFGMSDWSAQKFMQVADKFGAKSVTITDLTPSVLYALAAPSTPDEIREHVVERAAIETAIDRLIAILDTLDASAEDLEDGHDLELEDEHGEDLEGDDLDHGEDGDDSGIADSDGLNEQLSLEAAYV